VTKTHIKSQKKTQLYHYHRTAQNNHGNGEKHTIADNVGPQMIRQIGVGSQTDVIRLNDAINMQWWLPR